MVELATTRPAYKRAAEIEGCEVAKA